MNKISLSRHGRFPLLRWISVALIVFGLTACAGESYVVLVNNDDGSIGKVMVNGRRGSTLLEKNREATVIGSEKDKTFIVSEEKIAKDFGAALAASPKQPRSFSLYFETGGAKLTAKSAADIALILNEIASRAAPDVSIIGHTDSVGGDEENTRLGLTRATFVGGLLKDAKSPPERISVESHGKRNPLVATPDNTAEPQNRRVEVTVR